MGLPSITYTPDIAILAVLALIVVYGVVLGRGKVKTLALSVYVGLVISSELAAGLFGQLNSRQINFGGKLNQNTTALALFILPLLALELGKRDSSGHGGKKGGLVMTLVLCLLTSALAVASGLALLTPALRDHILGGSTIATAIYGLRLWWIALVPLAVVGENLIPKNDY